MPNYAIIVKGGDNSIREEIKAGGVITPGHLLEINSAHAVVVHNSAGETLYPLFALENDVQGDDIDDDYASGEQVQCVWARTGMQVQGILANGENAAIGSLLESQGDGTLRVVDADASAADIKVSSVVGVAREAVDMSGSSAADPNARITMTIL